ncbi:hypothetical protein NDU88_004453 [Pleurodeles waltl]|uniref:Uncharacterized protein n=1 Tax=Pleurodeles waltl TaxID=8319 RepID=A0AAV7M6D6_PLEWA|nr:hypothetical protein NDU88_004453 [Pleurodeles waltl]
MSFQELLQFDAYPDPRATGTASVRQYSYKVVALGDSSTLPVPEVGVSKTSLIMEGPEDEAPGTGVSWGKGPEISPAERSHGPVGAPARSPGERSALQGPVGAGGTGPFGLSSYIGCGARGP